MQQLLTGKMTMFSKCKSSLTFASVGVLLSLVACGGGGGSGSTSSNPNVGGPPQVVSGTAAKGAVLGGATVNLTCANGAVLKGTTSSTGQYITDSTSIAYPCIGSAVAAGGTPIYQGIIFSGAVANFSPLTDLLVQTVLAAAAPGSASLSLTDFVAKISSDVTFSTNINSSVTSFRATVLTTVRNQLSATNTSTQIDAILAAAATFDSTPFVAGSTLDQVLDTTAAVLQNADGSVKAAVSADVQSNANALPLPGSKATGSTGTSGT